MFAAIVVALAALLVKWPAFANPLSGYFGSYQAVNAMMAEMMGGGSLTNFFIPRTFSLVEGAPGLHLLYYPFGSLAAFLLDGLLGGGIPWWGRFQAGMFVFGATGLFYPVACRFLDRTKALLAVFFFSFFPMVMLSGASFQNEASALFFLVLAFWLLDSASLGKILLGGLVFSLALTARIHFGIALPAFLIWINHEKLSFWRTLIFLLGVLIPVGAWIIWIHALELQNPLHVQTSLFSQSEEGRFLMVSLFTSSEFYKRIFSVLGTYWCTPLLLPFALYGMFRLRRKNIVPLVWLWGSLSLIVLLPQKVVDHPFYLLVSAPALAILVVSALEPLWNRWGLFLKIFFCGAFLLLAFRYYLPSVLKFSEMDRNVPAMGVAIAKMSKPEDRIIVQGGLSAGILYYAHRMGWSFGTSEARENIRASKQRRYQKLMLEGYGDPVIWFEKLRKAGAKYFIITEPGSFNADGLLSVYVRDRYPEVRGSEHPLIVFKLEKN